MNTTPQPAPKLPSSKGPAVGTGLVFLSVTLIAFLGKWEPAPGDKALIVFADKLAGGIPTVCDGLTHHVTNTPIIVGEVWTHEKCTFERNRALLKVQAQVLRCFKVNPPQAVFDMASSHAWNNGAGATCGSSAMKAWNEGQWDLGCRRPQLSDSGKPVWSYVKTGKKLPNGKPEYKFVQGLANRRIDERGHCEKGA